MNKSKNTVKLKIAIIGNSNAGKTSFIKNLIGDSETISENVY
jgi:GTPase SAR1 family protein